MNRVRRESLRLAVSTLEEVKRTVDKALDEEQDALDSMPENLQFSERWEKMEQAVDFLDTASDNLYDAIEMISEAIQ